MRSGIIGVLILIAAVTVIVLKKPFGIDRRWSEWRQANVKLPFAVTVVETDEEKEQKQIQDQAKALFAAREFQKLDELAAKYRASREQYSIGVWKLNYVYAAFALPDETPKTNWPPHLATLRAWIKARPQSITARVALAGELTSYAWEARGSGYARTVTKEGWRLFGERLKEGLEVLNSAQALPEKCPRWWAARLTIALGLSTEREEYERLFAAAIKTDPQYAIYYFRKCYYLLPRWNGSPGEWESFLTSAADRIGGEDGDLLYARVVWLMHETKFFGNIFADNKLSWARTHKGFTVMNRRFPASFAAKSEHAFLAYLWSDPTFARDILARLEGKVDLSVWGKKEHFEKTARWVYAQ
jgi:hypothetical protein